VTIQRISDEDVIVWPCGTWCLREQLHEMTCFSDDYEVLPWNSERAAAYLSE
jgi:hypothetical protein